mgnify:CR=1 FL=1
MHGVMQMLLEVRSAIPPAHLLDAFDDSGVLPRVRCPVDGNFAGDGLRRCCPIKLLALIPRLWHCKRQPSRLSSTSGLQAPQRPSAGRIEEGKDGNGGAPTGRRWAPRLRLRWGPTRLGAVL